MKNCKFLEFTLAATPNFSKVAVLFVNILRLASPTVFKPPKPSLKPATALPMSPMVIPALANSCLFAIKAAFTSFLKVPLKLPKLLFKSFETESSSRAFLMAISKRFPAIRIGFPNSAKLSPTDLTFSARLPFVNPAAIPVTFPKSVDEALLAMPNFVAICPTPPWRS